MNLGKIIKIIKKYNRFLISAHTNLEGDAICSQLALARLLKKLGKKIFILNSDKIPALYNFLPGIKSAVIFKGRIPRYEVFFALDCADRKRLGRTSQFIKQDKITVNIDHHKSGEEFGDINWIMANVSSVCEMIYYLFKQLNLKIDKISALLLYVGILTDTGSFRFSNTGPDTHRIAAELLSKNLSASQIYQKIYEANPLEEMKILSDILNRFQTDKKVKVAWVEIKSSIVKKLDSRIDIADNLFDFLRSIKGIEVSIVFKEVNSNETKVNFRSRGKIDVAKFAHRFGGGGHHNASGCSLPKGIKQAKIIVLNEISKLI